MEAGLHVVGCASICREGCISRVDSTDPHCAVGTGPDILYMGVIRGLVRPGAAEEDINIMGNNRWLLLSDQHHSSTSWLLERQPKPAKGHLLSPGGIARSNPLALDRGP